MPKDLDPTIYKEVVRRISRRYRRRMIFTIHLVVYLVSLISATIMSDSFPPPVFAVWFLFLATHGIVMYFTEASDRAIQREIDRMREFYGPPPQTKQQRRNLRKHKRRQHTDGHQTDDSNNIEAYADRLLDADGELVDYEQPGDYPDPADYDVEDEDSYDQEYR